MKTLLIALRAGIFGTGFILLWGWVALSLHHRYDTTLDFALTGWTRVLGIALMAAGGTLAFTCIATFGTRADTPTEASSAFQHWKEKVRHRHGIPEGLTQAFLESETIDNVDADVLTAIYNSKHPPFFNAYMHGTPHKDLRFFMRMRVGAIPQIDSPEEVALVNCNGGGMDDGIWYFQHLKSELVAHTASSQQEKRLFATRRYNIETVIGKNDHLFSRATITYEPLVPGERVLKFGLLPTLRVTRVTGEGGQDLHFIQENRKEDGSFYAVLDEAPARVKSIPSPWNTAATKC
jgi:hypothetical protein